MSTVLDPTVARIPHVKLPRAFAGLSLASAMEGDGQIPMRTLRYLTFAGKKGSMPKWLSWMWVRKSELPLRFGKLEDTRKWVWSPSENLLSMVNIEYDPLEFTAEVLGDDSGRYEEATSELRHWFSETDLTESEMTTSKLDEEVLKASGTRSRSECASRPKRRERSPNLGHEEYDADGMPVGPAYRQLPNWHTRMSSFQVKALRP